MYVTIYIYFVLLSHFQCILELINVSCDFLYGMTENLIINELNILSSTFYTIRFYILKIYFSSFFRF